MSAEITESLLIGISVIMILSALIGEARCGRK